MNLVFGGREFDPVYRGLTVMRKKSKLMIKNCTNVEISKKKIN